MCVNRLGNAINSIGLENEFNLEIEKIIHQTDNSIFEFYDDWLESRYLHNINSAERNTISFSLAEIGNSELSLFPELLIMH